MCGNSMSYIYTDARKYTKTHVICQFLLRIKNVLSWKLILKMKSIPWWEVADKRLSNEKLAEHKDWQVDQTFCRAE